MGEQGTPYFFNLIFFGSKKREVKENRENIVAKTEGGGSFAAPQLLRVLVWWLSSCKLNKSIIEKERQQKQSQIQIKVNFRRQFNM